MMTRTPIRDAASALARDEAGKGMVKFVLGTCLVAIAAASTSSTFEANPLISGTIVKFRDHLPATLDAARKAMGG